ncbi:MAG: type VII secretion protein EssC [Hungatella sp.]|nr:type VII secretion protein EssC [Hungatella sp.]
MLVTLICEDNMYGELLPEKIQGQYWIEDEAREVTDPDRKLLGIEAEDGVWKVKAGRRQRLFEMESGEEAAELRLSAGQMYMAQLSSGKRGYIFTETYTEDRCIFKKYNVSVKARLHIGTNTDNQIVIENPFVSNVHGILALSGGLWSITDNNSKNGIYVNKKRIRGTAPLRAGDMIYIMGVKIVLGDRFLAVNNPDGQVKIHTNLLSEYRQEPRKPCEMPGERAVRFYYRSPGLCRGIVPASLKIEEPPGPVQEDETPMILVMGPSLVMGAASFFTGMAAVLNAGNNGGSLMTALPSVIMSLSMVCGMILFPFLVRTRERKRKKEKERERREKYLDYLRDIRGEIDNLAALQREILHENFPLVTAQMKKQGFYEGGLWSRAMGRRNFLTLRAGLGNVPLSAELQFPEPRFSLDDDVLRRQVQRFREEKQVLTGVPITWSLLEHRVSGIVGDGQMVYGILRHILIQLAAYHSYDEVKLVFLCDESRLGEFGYVRFLPHIWDNDHRERFLATNPEEVQNLSAGFTRIIEKRRQEKAEACPHYVVISVSKGLSDRCAFLAELLKDESVKGFSCLAAYDQFKNLPRECTCMIQAGKGQATMFDGNEDGRQEAFVPDLVTDGEAYERALDIGEHRLDLHGGRYALPGTATFLQMFRVGKYEHLNIASRWKENNPVMSLRTPVGVNSDGGLFYLDLHQREHGPHGLVAGMTGSGKSEFIITYVLSLAVNYSPDDVAFILIDYKGGGLVGAFDNEQYHLPHLAGTITNLDGASIARSLLSIQSELRRRQEIFQKAREAADEATMDIYKYQKLYRNRVVKEPVPHLFIISDEFAELKDQQPEFMSQLISTARIGRSLGVHLILATQKPSGVVNDQIWANSRFKVCLKVQDRADSMDMLKKPDAAELIETGRFYLQVGYNELFELGQSAWCGAPYSPRVSRDGETDLWVQMVDHQGNVLEEAHRKRTEGDPGNQPKEIVEIVRHIEAIAKEEGKKALPLWLPVIPPVVTVNDLEAKYFYSGDQELNPVIGELDDPFNQSQRLLTLPFTQKGHAICYGAAGSGKESFAASVLYSLYQHHDSRELNTYILDFGSETLGMFEEAPQTGGIVVAGEEEKAANLFHFLNREIRRRKKLLASVGGDYRTYRKRGGEDVPNILVVIQDYPGFSEQCEEISDSLPSMTRECAKYGVYFLLTSNSAMGVRYKLQQNFSQMFVLQLNDKSDYTGILGNTAGVYPSKIEGRGIVRENKNVYEFQTASVCLDPAQEADAVRAFCHRLKAQSGGRRAARIPAMPKTVVRESLGSLKVTFEQMPIGIRYRDLEPVCLNLVKAGTQQVLSMDRRELYPVAEGMAELIRKETDWELYVFDPAGTMAVEGIDRDHYITDKPEEAVAKLFGTAVERHNEWKRTGGSVSGDMAMEPAVVIFAGLAQIRKLLSKDGADKLRLILEKSRGAFGMSCWAMDDYSSSSSYSTQEWCCGEGFWIGGGLGDQMRFQINGRRAEYGKYVDPASGFAVRRGNAEKLKYLVSDRWGMEEDEEDE